MIVRQEMMPGALRVLAGVLGARAVSQFLESFLCGVTSRDAPAFAGVVVALGLVGLVARFTPARRASRTEPVTTLRSE